MRSKPFAICLGLFFSFHCIDSFSDNKKPLIQSKSAVSPSTSTGKLILSVTDKETELDSIVSKIDRFTATYKVYGESDNPKEVTRGLSNLFLKCSQSGKEKEDCSIVIMILDLGDRNKNIEMKHDKEFETKLKNDPEFRVKLNKMLGKPFTTSASNPMITAADVLKQ